MCTQSNLDLPVRYEHQGAQYVLHQSDGGRQDIVQWQRVAQTRVRSDAHQGRNNFAKGGSIVISKKIKRKGKTVERAILVFRSDEPLAWRTQERIEIDFDISDDIK